MSAGWTNLETSGSAHGARTRIGRRNNHASARSRDIPRVVLSVPAAAHVAEPELLSTEGPRRRAVERRGRVQRHPDLYRQQRASRSLASRAGHHSELEDALPAGGGAADLHAPVYGGEAGQLAQQPVWKKDLPQHGGGRIEDRFAGAERHDAARP